MNQDDIKKQLHNAEKPSDTKQKKDTDSSVRIVERALADAESGNTDNINEMFYASVKKIREVSEPDFLQIKARYGKLKGFLATDLNKITKVYRKAPAGDDSEKQGRTSKADMLIELVRSQGTFFHNADDEAFISFQVPHIDKKTGEETGQHIENHFLRSYGFKSWASYLFFTTYGTTPGDTAINESIDTLSGVGLFEGEEIETCLRYAFHEDTGTIYVDTANETWQLIEISPKGYKVIEGHTSPIKFIRPRTSRPLPLPEKGGDISLLWEHLNLNSQDSRLLILAWILEAMRINRPFPVCEIAGEQGSSKSTFQKRLREILDPNKVDLRSAPRNVEDIFISTRNNHLISYNNLSHLTANTQDAFCTLSTGGGDATRKLYSNSEEEAFEAMRPIIMNGISQLATRPDLGDRTIALELPRVKKYITEAKLKESWEKDLPLILGALYELLSKTLVELPSVTLDKPPRMADFTRLGQAMLNAQGIEKSFTDIFMRNRDRVVLRAIESSPVAQALVKMIDNDIQYKGTKGGLMDRLENINFRPKHFDRASWPKSVRGLSDVLRRLAPALRVQGIEIIEDKKRHKDGYRVTIRKLTTIDPEPKKKEIEL